MSERGAPPAIMCDTCGGWHPTEAHGNFDTDARAKRLAEIKARPDSAYRFDALGFKPDKTREIEPWMHTVIEKAKDLGDDLQDSVFLLHAGQLDADKKYPSALSFLTQESFQEPPEEVTAYHAPYSISYIWMERHNAGEALTRTDVAVWTFTYTHRSILQAQERWVHTRKPEDLAAYQEEIRRRLPGGGRL